MTAAEMLASDFATLPDLIRAHAAEQPDKVALAEAGGELDYATLDALVDRIAAALQRDGVQQGDAVAIVAAASIDYVAIFLGALRAGCVATPLAPSGTPDSIVAMIADCAAPITFVDTDAANALSGHHIPGKLVHLKSLGSWLAPVGAQPTPVTIVPEDGFNIIYSSGTTGVPKGIVQSHAMRWAHISRNEAAGSDWNIERQTIAARKAGQAIDEGALRDLYVETMVQSADFSDALLRRVTGRSPPQMLLLHETDVAARYIGDLVAALRRDGWTIVTADAAYADPLYRQTGDFDSANGTLPEAIGWQQRAPGPLYYARNDKPLADRLFAERVLHRTPIATPRCRVQRHPWRRVCSQTAFVPRRPLPLGIAA